MFPVGTKNANNNFLCGCLAETGAMTHNKNLVTYKTRTISQTTTQNNNIIEIIVLDFELLRVERTLTPG